MDPLTTSYTERTKLRSSIHFFGAVVIASILCNLLLFHFYPYSSSHDVHVDAGVVKGSPESLEQCSIPSGRLSSDPGYVQWQLPPRYSKNELQDIVATTKGFYVRDWSLHLGWNNIRSSLETAILHAQLLNRTLVIPSFVYAQACEYDICICENYAVMVNLNDAIHADEWREPSSEQKMGWRIPIEIMIDIPHLRSVHPIIFVSDYLNLRDLPDFQESKAGQWGRWGGEAYRRDYRPSSYTIHSRDYEPSEIVRVDNYNPEPWVATDTVVLRTNEALRNRLAELKKPLMSLKDAFAAISSVKKTSDPEELMALLKNAGWETLHTWDGALGTDFVKGAVKSQVEVAPRDNLRGFIQEYGGRTEEVLYLHGEIDHRKPGSMRFTNIESARRFASLVLHDIQPTRPIQNLVKQIIRTMDFITGNTLWVAAHMRHDDFVRHGWIKDNRPLEELFITIRRKVQRGYKTLQDLRKLEHTTHEAPYPLINELAHMRQPPYDYNRFYLATDERDPEALKYIKRSKAVLLKDIIGRGVRRELGWPLLFTDVVDLAEQQIIRKGAAYFCGHGLSCTAGGIVNIRQTVGWDPIWSRAFLSWME